MERNTTTIVELLKPGDRFYKLGDPGKVVYEFIKMEPGKASWLADHYYVKVKGRAVTINKKTQVVYLRNTSTA